MKNKYIISTFLFLLITISSNTFAQERGPETLPEDCQPCGETDIRYLTNIYSSSPAPSLNDITYTRTGVGNPRTLDIYGYPDECKKYPVIILVPGSGFVEGGDITAGGSVEIANYFARKGYAVAVLDYHRRVDPCESLEIVNSVVHEAAQDVNAAIQFLLGYSGTLKLDVNNIFVVGASAGGIASLSAIFSGLDGQLLRDELQPSNIGANYALNYKTKPLFMNINYTIKAFAGISTAVPTVGVFDDRVRNKDLPMIFMHGSGDATVPFKSGIPKDCDLIEKPTCGSGCIVDRIISSEENVNCYKLNEINSRKHTLLREAQGFYKLAYAKLVTEFFNDMINCRDCDSYHNVYPELTSEKSSGAFEATKGAIELIDDTPAITLYPNPVNTKITLDGIEEYAVVTITNLLGKQALSTTIHKGTKTIDVSTLPKGIYLIKVISNGVNHSEKIVIE